MIVLRGRGKASNVSEILRHIGIKELILRFLPFKSQYTNHKLQAIYNYKITIPKHYPLLVNLVD